MKYLLRIFLGFTSIALLTHCQKSSNSGGTSDGVSVAIPSMQIDCTSSNCSAASGNKHVYVYITTSGCTNISYGQVATGTGTVSCSAGACTTSSLSWSTNNPLDPNDIPSDTYNICALVDIAGTYAGTVTSSDSTTTTSGSSYFIDANTTTIQLQSWQNGAFTN